MHIKWGNRRPIIFCFEERSTVFNPSLSSFSYTELTCMLFVACFPGVTTHWVVSFIAQLRVLASSFSRFLDHTQRRATVGRTPLDEWSVRRRDPYLTTHNTHNRQTSMPPGAIRTHDRRRRAAEDLRLRPRGHWDRQNWRVISVISLPAMCKVLLVKLMTTLSLKEILTFRTEGSPPCTQHSCLLSASCPTQWILFHSKIHFNIILRYTT